MSTPEPKKPAPPQQTTRLRESWQPARNATGADPAKPPTKNPVPTPSQSKGPGG
jgi:hypothetical protein